MHAIERSRAGVDGAVILARVDLVRTCGNEQGEAYDQNRDFGDAQMHGVPSLFIRRNDAPDVRFAQRGGFVSGELYLI